MVRELTKPKNGGLHNQADCAEGGGDFSLSVEVGGGEYAPHEVVSEVVALPDVSDYALPAVNDDVLKQGGFFPAGKLDDDDAGLKQGADKQRPGKQGHDAFLSEVCDQTLAGPRADGEQDENPRDDVVHTGVNQVHQACLKIPKRRHCKQKEADGGDFDIKQFFSCREEQQDNQSGCGGGIVVKVGRRFQFEREGKGDDAYPKEAGQDVNRQFGGGVRAGYGRFSGHCLFPCIV